MCFFIYIFFSPFMSSSKPNNQSQYCSPRQFPIILYPCLFAPTLPPKHFSLSQSLSDSFGPKCQHHHPLKIHCIYLIFIKQLYQNYLYVNYLRSSFNYRQHIYFILEKIIISSNSFPKITQAYFSSITQVL